MTSPSRRSLLRAAGATGVAALLAGCSRLRDGEPFDPPEEPAESTTSGGTDEPPEDVEPGDWRLELVGHSLLDDQEGAYTQSVVRDDGSYAAVASNFGNHGTTLVDGADPAAPRVLHNLPADDDVETQDVKFDDREGLYYRGREGGSGGVDVIDYGYDVGTPEQPEIVATVDTGQTHNVFPLEDEPVLYSVDWEEEDQPGLRVWNVEDPAAPELVQETGPDGRLHDVVVDPERELAHAAYYGGEFEGYAIFDASDPRQPEVVGRFDYEDRPDYDDLDIGEQAFERCHYVDYDPERELTVVGDEIGDGNPGGKHVFDIGWDEGSPEDPVPVGFTLSPNAQYMEESDDDFAWTGHNFDFVPREEGTLLASGDYSEGVVLYDLTDPTAPEAIDRHPTDERADETDGPDRFDGPPRAWSADYASEAGVVVASDMFTGIYVFELVAA